MGGHFDFSLQALKKNLATPVCTFGIKWQQAVGVKRLKGTTIFALQISLW